MKIMRKSAPLLSRILLLLLLVMPLLSVGSLPAYASGELLVDEADLLTEEEEQTVRDALQKICDAWNMDVAVLTVDTMNGQAAMEFTDDYYDNNGYAEDGVILMVCMDAREYWISTSGKAINILSDMGIDFIGSAVAENLGYGDYESAFCTFATMVGDFAQEYESSGDAYDIDNPPSDDDYNFEYNGDYVEDIEQYNKRSGFQVTYLFIGLGLGMVVSLLIMQTYKGQVKNVHMNSGAGNYMDRDSVSIRVRQDRFLYRNVTRTARPKPQENRSGGGGGGHTGGSSIHMSSGGHSHGGGGGHF